MTDEKTLHRQVCEYLRIAHKGIIFNSDLSGSTKLTMNQAVALKKLRSGRGFPDLQIFEPRGKYHGLFIELKIEGTDLLKKRMVDDCGYPMWASDHIKEQHEMIERLEVKGYRATFAIGWDDAIKIIDEYLKK